MNAKLSKVNQKAQSKVVHFLLEQVSSYGVTRTVYEMISSMSNSTNNLDVMRLHAVIENPQDAQSLLLLIKTTLQKKDQYAAMLIEEDISYRTISIQNES